MNSAPIPTPHSAAAPELARRVGAILLAIAALVARAFLKDPRRVALIVPLWGRLNRAARRFERLMARLAAGPLPDPARPGGRSAAPAAATPRAALPAGQGWLVAALRHEAAAYASQLSHLLAEPEFAALVAATPRAARILRPICRMLGIRPPCLPPLPRRVPAAPAVAATPAQPAQPAPAPAPVMCPPPCPRSRWPWFPRPATRFA